MASGLDVKQQTRGWHMAGKALSSELHIPLARLTPEAPATITKPAERADNARHLFDAAKLAAPCRTCLARCNCHAARLMALLPASATPPHLSARTLPAGRYIFLMGDRSRFVYFVRSGSVKSCITSMAGDEQVVSFHLPGELLGLPALLETDVHRTSAITLQGTEVCALPAAYIEWCAKHTPGGLLWLFRLAGNEVTRTQRSLLLLNHMKAEARLGRFLLDLAGRYWDMGQPAGEFSLSMSRQDISNHLGLALETVSRLLSRFRKEGLLRIRARRHITILDAAGLAAR